MIRRLKLKLNIIQDFSFCINHLTIGLFLMIFDDLLLFSDKPLNEQQREHPRVLHFWCDRKSQGNHLPQQSNHHLQE